MPHIKGRKYEVTLPDGRVVSRQRAYQLAKGPSYNERYRKKWLAKQKQLSQDA